MNFEYESISISVETFVEGFLVILDLRQNEKKASG